MLISFRCRDNQPWIALGLEVVAVSGAECIKMVKLVMDSGNGNGVHLQDEQRQ